MPLIAEPWPRSRGRSSSMVNEMQPPDSSARRAIRTGLLLGSRTLEGSLISSMCVYYYYFCWAFANLVVPLSGRTGNRYQHGRCGHPHGGHGHPRSGCGHPRGCYKYPHNDRGYPSKCIGGARRYFRPKPLGRCDLLSINNRMFTTI